MSFTVYTALIRGRTHKFEPFREAWAWFVSKTNHAEPITLLTQAPKQLPLMRREWGRKSPYYNSCHKQGVWLGGYGEGMTGKHETTCTTQLLARRGRSKGGILYTLVTYTNSVFRTGVPPPSHLMKTKHVNLWCIAQRPRPPRNEDRHALRKKTTIIHLHFHSDGHTDKYAHQRKGPRKNLL